MTWAFTLALLAMCLAGIGIVYWLYRMIQSQIYIEAVLSSTHEEVIDIKKTVSGMRSDVSEQLEGIEVASQKGFKTLVNAMQKAFEATGTLIADTSEGSAKDSYNIKTQLASIRHDSAIDAGEQDKRFDALNTRIYDSTNSIHGNLNQTQIAITADIRSEHITTRERITQIKTRLADEESQDQREKAKLRRSKKKI